MAQKIERKIKLQVLDPTGVDIDPAIEIDYYNFGWEIAPEELEYEPNKRVRYLLTIGEHQYWVNRKGEIMEKIISPNLNTVENEPVKKDNSLRNHYAGLAMQAIMQSEMHMNAAEMFLGLTNDKLEVQDAISVLALTQAESMLKMMKRIDEEKEK